MKNKAFIFVASFFFLLALGSLEQVSACSCIRGNLPCMDFGDAKAVFVGKVVGSKEQKKTNFDGKEEVYDVGEIYFEVEEAFSGVKKAARVTISSGTRGGDCGFWFKRGETYLVYGYGAEKGSFTTNICTRTREISKASEDLDFLRNLPLEKSGAKVFGNVTEQVLDPEKNSWLGENPLLGIAVTITNSQNPKLKYKAETDSQGYFEVNGIPAGKYKINPKIPKNTSVDDYSQKEFELNDRGCAIKNFTLLSHQNKRRKSYQRQKNKTVSRIDHIQSRRRTAKL